METKFSVETLVNFYRGKKVVITGHAGFKGAWLSLFLSYLGAEVYGFGHSPQKGGIFELAKVKKVLKQNYYSDISNFDAFYIFGNRIRPDIIFHLAAQPLVLRSYEFPYETIHTNIIGTANVLETAELLLDCVSSVVIITTDKVYQDNGQISYRETDRLGGKDIYSFSKASMDLMASAYRDSFNLPVAVCRAGNVIGGGDVKETRLIPDIVKSVEQDSPIILRFPQAIRSWSYILDVLYGYLLAGMFVTQDKKYRSSYNFASSIHCAVSVKTIASRFLMYLTGKNNYPIKEEENSEDKEAQYLYLNSDKAKRELGWKHRFTLNDFLYETAYWYYTAGISGDLETLSIQYINRYLELLRKGY